MSLFRLRRIVMSLAVSTLPFAQNAASQDDPRGFAQVLPDQVPWRASKATPPGGEGAAMYGDSSKPGLFINRFRQPANYKVPPHRHPEDRVYTVMSGTFYIGFGDRLDPSRLKAYPPGSVFVVPANASHFHWMRSGEAVVQITGVGPSGIDYVDRADDPR